MSACTLALRLLLLSCAGAAQQVALSHGGRLAPVTVATQGGQYLAYFAIPYAKPPLGELRFRDPLPAAAWPDVRQPSSEGNACLQAAGVPSLEPQHEDCLLLNVYTATSPENQTERLPVMVWFHGGGFAIGSSSRVLYGPDYLVARGVILVAPNYRLGPLGFLSTGDSVVPGNMGLKDQVLALQWVKDNIAAFGGDPSRVTIFGESAGGASVHFHMLSPMSRGLFQGAISQSGSALNPWALTLDGGQHFAALSAQLGCSSADSAAAVSCLRGLPAHKIAGAVVAATKAADELFLNPFRFVPTLDPSFLPEHPEQLMARGHVADVPYISGLNSHEGLLMFVMMSESDGSYWDKLSNSFAAVADVMLLGQHTPEQVDRAASAVRRFYFGVQAPSNKTEANFVQLSTDAYFWNAVQRSVELHAEKSSAPVYQYLFEFDGERNVVKKNLLSHKGPGACHGDELGYLFAMNALLARPAAPGSAEETTITRMTTMWTDFAKMGAPTPEGSAEWWPPFELGGRRYLSIGSELQTRSDLWADRRHFWTQLERDASAS